MLKFISIVGARPQFIKLGPFSRELRKHHKEVIVHTGQHYDKQMSELLFRDLEIPAPDHNLNVGSEKQGKQTGLMLMKIEEVLEKEKPDFTVVFGDTNSTLAGSLAAAKLHIPSIHIEAGLRSYNKQMPEEVNRIVSDHTSDHLFAPTLTAMGNLRKEGLEQKAYLTGDIMVDSVSENIKKAIELSSVDKQFDIDDAFYLMTLHRPYNVDNHENLQTIFNKLGELDTKIIFPAHPRTLNVINQNNLHIPSNIKITGALGYLDFLKLEHLSSKIITDSGGIQKEAYILSRPCITLRSETEWTETVVNGWNILLDHNDSDFAYKLVNFNPGGFPPPVFGNNVAGNMISTINSFIAG